MPVRCWARAPRNCADPQAGRCAAHLPCLIEMPWLVFQPGFFLCAFSRKRGAQVFRGASDIRVQNRRLERFFRDGGDNAALSNRRSICPPYRRSIVFRIAGSGCVTCQFGTKTTPWPPGDAGERPVLALAGFIGGVGDRSGTDPPRSLGHHAADWLGGPPGAIDADILQAPPDEPSTRAFAADHTCGDRPAVSRADAADPDRRVRIPECLRQLAGFGDAAVLSGNSIWWAHQLSGRRCAHTCPTQPLSGGPH